MSSSSPLPVPTFLNDHEARTVDALAGRIVPGDERDPGAREAGAVVYIDRALAGAYDHLQPLYQSGVRELDQLSRELHGASFKDLSGDLQDAVLTEIDVVVEALPTEHGAESDGDGLRRYLRRADRREPELRQPRSVLYQHVRTVLRTAALYGVWQQYSRHQLLPAWNRHPVNRLRFRGDILGCGSGKYDLAPALRRSPCAED